MAAEGLVTVPSKFGAHQTMDRLEALIKERGMTVSCASIMRPALRRPIWLYAPLR